MYYILTGYISPVFQCVKDCSARMVFFFFFFCYGFHFVLDMTSAAQHLGPSQLVTHMFAEPGHKAQKAFTFGSPPALAAV